MGAAKAAIRALGRMERQGRKVAPRNRGVLVRENSGAVEHRGAFEMGVPRWYNRGTGHEPGEELVGFLRAVWLEEGGVEIDKRLGLLLHNVVEWNEWREVTRDYFGRHTRIDLSHASLAGLRLDRADLSEVDLSKAILARADLRGADFRDSDLAGADLTEADALGASFVDANLIGAILARARLDQTDFRGANLVGANLSGTAYPDMEGYEPGRGGAQLRDACLNRANLTGANLSGANLSGATLFRAWLCEADLAGTNLFRAGFDQTVLASVDLSAAKGLNAVRHYGPSTVGIDTLLKSSGKIPDKFLRSAGVPEDMISHAHSLAGKADVFYSAFISYNGKDHEFAERLHADLQAKGVRIWFAPEDLKIGDKFRSRIDEAIHVYDKLMVVLSANSVGSAWVEKEVETAFEKERKENRTVLFPIRLDDEAMTTSQAWAADIRRTRHIGDFCRWKDHDDYQKAFSRLLRDLQADDKRA